MSGMMQHSMIASPNRLNEAERNVEAIRLQERLHELDLQLMVVREEERAHREHLQATQLADSPENEDTAIAAVQALSESEDQLRALEAQRAQVEEAHLLLSSASWWTAPAPSAPVQYPSLAPPPPMEAPPEQRYRDAPPGYNETLQHRFGERRFDDMAPAQSASDLSGMRRTSSSQRILHEREARYCAY